jgi:hypothetical protein
VRILALVSLVLAGICVLGVAATTLGQAEATPPRTETVALEPKDFPPLRPIAPVAQAAPRSPASGGAGADERVLIAATYWLLLGGLALRRVTRRAQGPSTPVSGWDFGHAPPLPK